MVTYRGKFKKRKRTLSRNECFIYQLIESCLKYDLEKTTALKVINLILKHYYYLLKEDNSQIISLESMTYRNYRRYVNELMGMSPIHKKYFKQFDKTNVTGTDQVIAKTKSKDKRHFENLLFLLQDEENENTNDNNKSKLPYKKIKIANTDNLVFRALIQIDKSYIF